jgi:hypothetical protein
MYATPTMNSVRYGCTSLVGSSLAGKLLKDDQGYYEVVVGALQFANSVGQVYVYEQAKHLFANSSQLMRRVSKGALRGEYGHPKRLPGQSLDAFANRIMSIWEENVCCHFREITLDFNRVLDKDGKPIIAIIAWVKPAGPHAKALQDSLDNPNENVCFSIRSFTEDYKDARGTTCRVLKTIVTWDYVNEPGISVAEKFQSPSLESLEEESFSRGNLERAYSEDGMSGMGIESSYTMSYEELCESFGWTPIPAYAVQAKPDYMSW